MEGTISGSAAVVASMSNYLHSFVNAAGERAESSEPTEVETEPVLDSDGVIPDALGV